MVRFQCETCGRLKDPNEAWILGLAAENIGLTAARREISIESIWDRERAVDILAVHFCSDQCRVDYMNALFGDTPETRLGGVTVTKRRVKRVIPGAVVDTVIAEKRPTRVVKRKVIRRKSA